MRFLKAALVWVLCFTVFLNGTLSVVHAQSLNPDSGNSDGQNSSSNNQNNNATPWETPDYLNENERQNSDTGNSQKKPKLDLKDTMNFEECVNFKMTPQGAACPRSCSGVSIPLGWTQYDYYEPIALVESVPKPWSTMFNETENYISKAFTKFEKTPFGGDEGVQTIKTNMGNYPQRYFEAHVWGISVPTRYIMLANEGLTKLPTDPRIMAMLNSLVYEFGLIATEMSGSGEINSLQDAARAFENVVLNFFSMGGYTYVKIFKALKAMYEALKDLYEIVMAFIDAMKALKALINDPLQAAINKLVELIVGEIKKEHDKYKERNKDKPKKEGLVQKLNKKIKEIIKKLKEEFGEIITALQLEKAWKVFGNFAAGITKQFKEFTDGWTTQSGESAQKVGKEAGTCSNPDWLCDAQGELMGAQGEESPLYTGTDWSGNGSNSSGSSDTSQGTVDEPSDGEQNANQSMRYVNVSTVAVNNRISELGGSCKDGKPVGNWGDRVTTSCDGGLLQEFSRAMDAINKMQDIFRSGSIPNILGAAAGSIIPVGLLPSYISEFDRPAWNKGTANMISVFESMVASTPWLCAGAKAAAVMGAPALDENMKKSFCIGIWGPVYPKVGAVPMDDPHTAAGITNFRAFSLAAAWGTFPIPYDAKKSGPVKFNVDHPYKSKCYQVGTAKPQWNSKMANEGGSAALNAMTGDIEGAVANVGATLQAVADNPVKNVTDKSKTDGWVHTYWKRTRVCEVVCSSGVKWKKLY